MVKIDDCELLEPAVFTDLCPIDVDLVVGRVLAEFYGSGVSDSQAIFPLATFRRRVSIYYPLISNILMWLFVAKIIQYMIISVYSHFVAV